MRNFKERFGPEPDKDTEPDRWSSWWKARAGWEACLEEIEKGDPPGIPPLQRTSDGALYVKNVDECNCAERVKQMDSWICPAHGYKKR